MKFPTPTHIAPARTTIAINEITGEAIIIENPEYTKIKMKNKSKDFKIQ